MTRSVFVHNGDIRLHVLDSDPAGSRPGVPVVFVPGGLGRAEAYTTAIDALSDRRVIAMSLRGRGQSDAPHSGYTFADHVSDMAAVLDHVDLLAFCLCGYSMSVPLSISYVAANPDRLAGLILIDFPAHLPPFPPGWAERVLETQPDRVPTHVIHALVKDAVHVDVWDDLQSITVPTLILHGGQPESQLSAADARRYLEHLPHAEVVVFEESGHQPWHPDRSGYLATLETFLMKLDQPQ